MKRIVRDIENTVLAKDVGLSSRVGFILEDGSKAILCNDEKSFHMKNVQGLVHGSSLEAVLSSEDLQCLLDTYESYLFSSLIEMITWLTNDL